MGRGLLIVCLETMKGIEEYFVHCICCYHIHFMEFMILAAQEAVTYCLDFCVWNSIYVWTKLYGDGVDKPLMLLSDL